MRPAEIHEHFERNGHVLSAIGGQIKVMSTGSRPAPADLQLLRANKGAMLGFLREQSLYRRMRLAIGRIEAVYDPDLAYPGTLLTRKYSLDNMPLNTMSDIGAFESAWLELLRISKQNRDKNSDQSVTKSLRKQGGTHV